MIYLTTGKPGSAKSFPRSPFEPHCFVTYPGCPCAHCTPPAENSNPPGVPLGGADGQGVCIPKLSNLDSTRRKAVKKGCVVQYVGGATARVARVRLGSFWVDLGSRSGPTESWSPCSQVKVISS